MENKIIEFERLYKKHERIEAKMKKVFWLLIVVSLLAAGFFVMAAGAKGDRVPDPISTAQPSSVPAMTEAAKTCEVYTGVDAGTVNLRSCAGTSCGVLDTLTEGESLTILTAGLWTQATRADGVTGWLNSKYCKGK